MRGTVFAVKTRMTSDTRPSEQIHEEHGGIKTLLTRLEGAGSVQELLGTVEVLRSTLTGHFAFEESDDGMASVVRDNAPERMDELEALFEEHGALSKALDALEALTHDLVKSRDAFVARVRKHEEKESDLLSGALYDDLGCGD